MNIYSTPYLAVQHLRESYTLPRHNPLETPPEIAHGTPLGALSKKVLYHIDQAELALKHFRLEPENRNHLTMVMVHCEVLRRLGYDAKADMKRPLVRATRFDLTPHVQLVNRALLTIPQEVLDGK